MKIFIGPCEIAGFVTSLQKGFIFTNTDMQAIFSSKHSFGYENRHSDCLLIDIWQRIGIKKNKLYKENKTLFLILCFFHWVYSFLVLFWSINKFDVFIFVFGETITNTKLELALLKFLKKKLVFIYLGSDSRPPFIDGKYDGEIIDFKNIIKKTKKMKHKIILHDKYADAIINSPFASHFHTVKVVNWFSIGFAKELMQKQEFKNKIIIRILHAPSNPKIKGSAFIEKAIKTLIKKGYKIEFIKVHNQPNSVVIDELKKCDFVIDQVFSDTPLAGLASEAACLGKPSVVCGYAASKIANVCKGNLPPSLYVLPLELESAIECLVTDCKYRKELGEQAYQFMEQHWSCNLVAQKLLRIINGDIPEEWLFDPNSVDYLEGFGLSQEKSKVMIREIIEQYGISSLQIEDKPVLKKAYMKYCGLSGEIQ